MSSSTGGVSFGVYKNNSTWAFYFDYNGNLAVGSVPGSLVTGTVPSATNASYATYANSAGSATNATYATSAGSATNATFATNAGNGITQTSGSPAYYGARSWINFDGSGTPSIRASVNVSSITDNGVGDYTINFATAMPDANYTWHGGVTWSTSYGGLLFADNTYPPTTTTFRFYTASTSYAQADVTRITVGFFR
jgi:hypothetical protein